MCPIAIAKKFEALNRPCGEVRRERTGAVWAQPPLRRWVGLETGPYQIRGGEIQYADSYVKRTRMTHFYYYYYLCCTSTVVARCQGGGILICVTH